MSEFTGTCYHLVGSDGWCDECKKKVKILFTDGKTSGEIDSEEKVEEEE